MEKRSDLTSKDRPAVLAGLCYPENRDRLVEELDQLFSDDIKTVDARGRNSRTESQTKALMAPHIDPRVTRSGYQVPFSSIRHLKPRRVVILATAHYTGYAPHYYVNHPFIGTRKRFLLPHGALEVDQDAIDMLDQAGEKAGYTGQDLPHRQEHSIELHLLYLRYLWKHEFNIVPLLVSSFDQLFYMPNGHLQNQIDQMSSLLRSIDDSETIFLVSGDLSHVGPKFGDPQPAARMRQRVKTFDQTFIDRAISRDSASLLKHVANRYDPYRVCGFAPLYTLLNTFPELSGSQLHYGWWNDEEFHSAVSYCGLRFHD